MKPLDPPWIVTWLYVLLRQFERGLGGGWKKKAVARFGDLVQPLTYALMRLSVPRANDPWFTDAEANAAEQEKRGLLKALEGRVQPGARGSKPHIGPLSPGCKICMDGYWGCNYINGRCQKRCFYCTQRQTEDRKSRSDGFTFESPLEHVHFLKAFHVKGVGFSGGEPLLALDRLLSHITAIRKEFGPSMYLWAYTNGDLVNRERLKSLKDAGLDELRFDLSAREYDLTPVALAKKYIPAVTVEIPAIPEDFELVKKKMIEMQDIGVDFLNLHELFEAQRNWRACCVRNYHLSYQWPPAVIESEICALRLMLYAHDQQLRLPINYCCAAYKRRFQVRGFQTRVALAAIEDFQEVTNAGYIRSLSISGPPGRLATLVRRLEEAPVDRKLWQLDSRHACVTLHESAMSHVDWDSATLTIRYYEPRITLRRKSSGFHPDNLSVRHRLVKSATGLNRTAFENWQRLCSALERTDGFASAAPSIQEYAHPIASLALYENLESGLPAFR